eukprot:CAMPEP_0119118062 /NCGR_PEP_ID=MMETSP1180-20130426/53188_1 /TAXON_ID=3052 ORGANISM="Chlamydomonas cf sp, Strain CCMP681" /NCGR_SAMPLE_ID=MMETSP1180 /ASSEMBLY_ACC=CAM_ASM_000741 /LENGTH=90 /DNA_ID=CAMNT_0007107397 /DNA_START=1254 /DNA_END=1526 /DNA_ORIENTATION=-
MSGRLVPKDLPGEEGPSSIGYSPGPGSLVKWSGERSCLNLRRTPGLSFPLYSGLYALGAGPSLCQLLWVRAPIVIGGWPGFAWSLPGPGS